MDTERYLLEEAYKSIVRLSDCVQEKHNGTWECVFLDEKIIYSFRNRAGALRCEITVRDIGRIKRKGLIIVTTDEKYERVYWLTSMPSHITKLIIKFARFPNDAMPDCLVSERKLAKRTKGGV